MEASTLAKSEAESWRSFSSGWKVRQVTLVILPRPKQDTQT